MKLSQIETDEYDLHIIHGKTIFRDIGFDISAMQYPRCQDATSRFKKFLGVKEDYKLPFAMNYHPNKYMMENYRKYY